MPNLCQVLGLKKHLGVVDKNQRGAQQHFTNSVNKNVFVNSNICLMKQIE